MMRPAHNESASTKPIDGCFPYGAAAFRFQLHKRGFSLQFSIPELRRVETLTNWVGQLTQIQQFTFNRGRDFYVHNG
jgi:hypothetical protein